jgi:hypothetical protein
MAQDESASGAAGKSGLWLGVLPFIGVILFLGDLIFILTGGATGSALHRQVLEAAVTCMVGWAGVGAGIAHIFFGKSISRSIGFERNAFEFEVGVCDLSLGIVGLMASHYPAPFWLAVIWASSLFRIGCGIGHVREIVVKKNYAINNTAILFLNFVVPAFLLAAYYSWMP